MQVPLTAINIPWNRVAVEEWPPNDGSWGQVQRRSSSKALMGWLLWLLRLGAGGLPWARGPGPLRLWGPPGWPRMWRKRWSGANPSVVSPRGRGCHARRMGGRCSRGGTHNSTALSDSRGSGWRRGGGWSSGERGGSGGSWAEAGGKGRGGSAHRGSSPF